MIYDVYDFDEQRWSCWDDKRGYLCDWMPERDYLKWYWVNLGCLGRRLPGRKTIYRSEADQKEAEREHGLQSDRLSDTG